MPVRVGEGPISMKRSKPWTVKKEVLSFDPSDRRGEPVGKEFYEDDIGELLTLFSRTPVLLIPLAKDIVETRRDLVANNLNVFLRDLE
jgi:hypothetical protein